MSTKNNSDNFQEPHTPSTEIGQDHPTTCQEIGQNHPTTCHPIPYPPDPAYPTGSTKVLYDGIYTFLCPHCNLVVAVEKNEVNCHIFRHGNYITQRDQSGRAIGYGDSINPHTPKHVCDDLFSRNQIIGCGKPLQMYVSSEGQYYVRICDYI